MKSRRPSISTISQGQSFIGLLVLLAYSIIATGALNHNPGTHVVLQQAALRDTGGVVGDANNLRRRHHPRGQSHLNITSDISYGAQNTSGVAGVTGGETDEVGTSVVDTGAEYPEAIEISGADLTGCSVHLDGVYLREWDINGAPHFKRRSKRGSRTTPVHLYFAGSEWVLHLDVDTDVDVESCLAFSEVVELNPLRTTRRWAVRVGQAWVRRPHMRLAKMLPGAEAGGSHWRVHDHQESGRVYGTTEGDPRFQDSGSTAVGQALGQKRQGSPTGADSASASDAALTRRLLPLYLVFVLDAVGLGVALPALPFFVMGLKASALQLAVVISSNYIAQTFGCVITGNLSDTVGRKPVVICCMLGTIISHIMVARSTTLGGVARGRIIGGITGGMTPIAQAAVADVVPVQSLPKFMGRIQACVGLGFVLGPATMTVLNHLFRVSTADTFIAAAAFPLVGMIYAMFRMSETKPGDTGISQLWRNSDRATSSRSYVSSNRVRTATSTSSTQETHARATGKLMRDRATPSHRRPRQHAKHKTVRTEDQQHHAVRVGREPWSHEGPGAGDLVSQELSGTSLDAQGASGHEGLRDVPGGVAAGGKRAEIVTNARGAVEELIPRAVMLLVGNGFLLMYAFSIETIYAMFLKDNFGYGESVLSMVFALNGLAVGALQLFGMRHLVRILGKHVMLIVGNVLLAVGMVGMALSRQPVVHFALFTLHIMGYSLADTALVALISRYASPATQGRSMGLNQAAQSLSRVVSPVVAGVLYEWSKRADKVPLGALPYLVGSAFPLVGVAVPFWLYLRSVDTKKRRGMYSRGGWSTQASGGSRQEHAHILQPAAPCEATL